MDAQLQQPHRRRRHEHQRRRLRARQRPGGQRAASPTRAPSSRPSAPRSSSLCQELAREIAADGEGATRLLEVSVTGAPTTPSRATSRKSIAGSLAGEGGHLRRGPELGPRARHGRRARRHARLRGRPGEGARSRIQGSCVYDRAPALDEPERAQGAHARARGARRRRRCARATGQAVAWGCDLSYDYVKINADYTSLIVLRAGRRRGEGRPAHQLQPGVQGDAAGRGALVHLALRRASAACSSTAARPWCKDSLKASFCEDIELLALGRAPAHRGARRRPGDHPTLEKLGASERVHRRRARHRPVGPQGRGDGAHRLASTRSSSRCSTAGGRRARWASPARTGPCSARGSSRRTTVGPRPGGRGARGEPRLPRDAAGARTTCRSSPRWASARRGRATTSTPTPPRPRWPSRSARRSSSTSRTRPGSSPTARSVTELTADGPRARSSPTERCRRRKRLVQAILRALAGGVERVHVLDGRMPHGIIAELFTDDGVGTLVTAG